MLYTLGSSGRTLDEIAHLIQAYEALRVGVQGSFRGQVLSPQTRSRAPVTLKRNASCPCKGASVTLPSP